MPLSRHSAETYQETSSHATRQQLSQLAELVGTDPGLRSGITVRELIFEKKKEGKKSAGGE